ncbi:MAG: Abi family protein [Xanthomonadales bacterium]|nr:Abi family protein [Xanthomonadales bacterium]
MSQTKPWKSFPEQLSILRGRALLVDNETAALDYLERIGYYRLSGYWYSFRDLVIRQSADGKISHYRTNQFIPDSHFKNAVELYVFDKKLRLLALDALERIELAVRVDIAHLLGEKDIHAHENPTLFHGRFSKQKIHKGVNIGKTQHQLWLTRHEQVIRRARREPFVSHYMQKYGKLPIWVAIEVWDFGLMSKLFAGMRPVDQLSIAKKYGATNGKMFAGWLRSFNFIRNVSAHHSRLWNINVLERSALLQDDEYWKN